MIIICIIPGLKKKFPKLPGALRKKAYTRHLAEGDELGTNYDTGLFLFFLPLFWTKITNEEFKKKYANNIA